LESILNLETRPAVSRGRRRTGEVSGREALLKAALKYFSRHGYEAVSLRALALDAGVDMALVARLFGSKADLWLAVIQALAERQQTHMEHVRLIAEQAKTDPENAMREFILLFTQISFEMPEFPAFFLQEVGNEGPRLDVIIQQLINPFKAECEPIIHAAAVAGVISASQSALFFGMLVSAISLPMVSPATFSSEPSLTPAFRDEISQQAISIFVRPTCK
jgi:AcrR family transcriptional regulator